MRVGFSGRQAALIPAVMVNVPKATAISPKANGTGAHLSPARIPRFMASRRIFVRVNCPRVIGAELLVESKCPSGWGFASSIGFPFCIQLFEDFLGA